jgi:radical SAM protein with 4Fe4S-binding SPASM domain
VTMADRTLPACLTTRAGWHRYLDLARRPEPHLHQIEPTNACPYSCSMCTRPRMRRPVGFMDIGLFRKVMAEVAGYAPEVRALDIELFHFGESLLHPRLPEMVACASGLGLRPVLSVNPPQLRPDLAEALVRARPARIICSLDADDEATYRQMRGPRADFAQALAGIEALLDANRRLGAPVPVQVRMIQTRLNQAQTEAFQARWADRGAQVEVRPFFPWNDPDLAALGDWERLPPGMPCPFPWRYLVVQWNGDVVPCCRDCDGEVVLGNAGGQTLKEIWNGPAYAEFRRRLAAPGRPSGMCGPCMGLYGTGEGG